MNDTSVPSNAVDGDLCVMHGDSQSAWLHGIQKEPEVTGQRLSITFRFHAAA